MTTNIHIIDEAEILKGHDTAKYIPGQKYFTWDSTTRKLAGFRFFLAGATPPTSKQTVVTDPAATIHGWKVTAVATILAWIRGVCPVFDTAPTAGQYFFAQTDGEATAISDGTTAGLMLSGSTNAGRVLDAVAASASNPIAALETKAPGLDVLVALSLP